MTTSQARCALSASLFALLLLPAGAALAQDSSPFPPPVDQPAAPPPAAAPVAPAPEAAAPAVAAPATNEDALPAAPAGPVATGSLEIFSDQPGAEVVVDGHRVGKTPVRVDNLTVGAHTIQVSREGGAALTRDVVVQEGLTVRMDAAVAGGPVRQAPGTLGAGSTPAATAAPSASNKPSLPGREFFSTFLEQPWAWVAAAVCGATLLVAAILWTAQSPGAILPFGLGDNSPLKDISADDPRWLVVKWGSVVAAGVSALVALGLFIWPSLPFAKMVQLPGMSSIFGKTEAKPQQATQPAPK